MIEDMIPIGLDDYIKFNCCSKNVCFNECCRDLSQALTPYDILRLKNNLEISSQIFLKKYTSMHYGPESGLPIVEFKPNPGTGHECPFVTEKGCAVYEDRPASCRMYPLARAVAKTRETGGLTEFFALIEEPHCKGFRNETKETVGEWLQSQDVRMHNKHNDKLIEIISLKNKMLPGMLEGIQSDQFYLALYDLDEFRQQIFTGDLLKDLKVSKEMMDQIQKDDEALLGFGITWVKYMLFGIEITL
ncbi:MAG: YkgJ family cysteine cluster protein [Desulfobacteraceae bacterium]|nr:YkgJ family cysteine cluster protein [Desulfobacteraceae bacterium]